MPAVDGQYALRRGLLRCGPRPAAATRDPQSGFTREDAGFFVDGFTLDQKGLADAGKVEVGIERRAAPNAARFDAAMIRRCDLDEIRGDTRREQQSDIAFQHGLVAFDSEMIVSLVFDQIGGQRALRQQLRLRDLTLFVGRHSTTAYGCASNLFALR